MLLSFPTASPSTSSLRTFLSALILVTSSQISVAKEAEPPLTAKASPKSLNSDMSAEWIGGPRIAEDQYYSFSRYDDRRGVLKIYKAGNPSPVQEFDLEVNVYRDAMDITFVDINGDNADDILFFGNLLDGNYRQALHVVYMWVPAKQKFIRSKTLSEAGHLEHLPKTNCVRMSNICEWLEELEKYAVATKDLCFNQKLGLWKTVRSTKCKPIED